MSHSSNPDHRDARGAFTLPGKLYSDPKWFERECDEIFTQRWIYVGREERIAEPSSYFLHSVASESVIVLRDEDGHIRAHHNLCRHRGTRLLEEVEGVLSKHIRCPYHAWSYTHDGCLVGAPNMNELPGFDRDDYPLHSVAVAEWEGGLFIHLGSDPVPFEEAWAPFLGKFDAWEVGDLRIAHSVTYDIRANWKLVFQNYSECYHCPSLHPQLNRLTPYRDSENDLEEGPFLGGPMKLARSGGSMTMSGARCAAPLPGVTGRDLDFIYYYTVFPSMLLSLHPDYVLVHRIEPLAVDRTRIVCDWLFHRDEIARTGFDPSDAVEFWSVTNEQDWQVSELSQRGVSSRFYTPGPYSQLESMIAAFDREYLRTLGETGETI